MIEQGNELNYRLFQYLTETVSIIIPEIKLKAIVKNNKNIFFLSNS